MAEFTDWEKKTALFLTSQTISLLGTSLVQYALLWYVTLETKSGIMMTIYIICGFVPTFLLSPFAGVWADRYNRKNLIIYPDAFIALATLALAIVFMMGGKALWLVMVTAAIRALGSAIQGPALGAILPQFVPAEQLTRINGINGTLQATIMFASPVLSGVLTTMFPIQTVFFIDVVTATIAISVMLFFLKVPLHKKATEKQTTTYFADLKLGFEYIKNHKYLKSFFIFVAVLMFLVSPASMLTPLQVVRSFGEEIWRLTAIEVVFSAGMMIGGGLIAIWGGCKNRIHTMILATLVIALFSIGLGVVPWFWIYLVFMGMIGIAIPFYNTPSTVLIQEHVDENYLGRVFSIMTMIFTAVMPLGMLIFGPLAEVISIEWLLIGAGIFMIIQMLFVLGDKRLLEAGKALPSSRPLNAPVDLPHVD